MKTIGIIVGSLIMGACIGGGVVYLTEQPRSSQPALGSAFANLPGRLAVPCTTDTNVNGKVAVESTNPPVKTTYNGSTTYDGSTTYQ